ncbi:DUF3618 domain-containing protein [Nocardia salmonicida]|uniref:DUF3618 domain-containing protein n=1 Tax=Nocardia salmonicida TaxID=53431 RepID=UPI0036C62CAF
MNEPNDPEALRRDREQARQELGETVAELTDKLDVPARAKDKVHDAADAAKDRVTDAKYQTLAAADQARDKADQVQAVAKAKADEVQAVAKAKADQVQAVAKEKTRHAAEKVESSVPEPVTERSKQAAEVARRNPIPVAAAAISATALVWWLARRRRS